MAKSPLDIEALRHGATPSRGAMARTVFALSLPAILAELSSTLMQYIDASMVGSLGAHASAAIGVIESTMWLLGGLAMSATMGFTVQVAQLVGAGRDRDARNVFRQSMVVSTLFGTLLFAIGLFAAGSLPERLGADPQLWADASRYLSICSITLIPLTLARLGTGMLQCSGDMLTPSVLNVLSCVLDVGFNALLIPDPWSLSVGSLTLHVPSLGWGVAGAAVGTLLAQTVTAILLLWFACARSERLALREQGIWLPQRQTLRPAWSVCWPLFVERIVLNSSYIACTAIIAPLGVVATAANSLAITAEGVCYMPGMGMEAAATTLVGQAIGADRRDVARSFARLSTVLGMLVMAAMGALMYLLAPHIMAMLTPDEAVRALGAQVLRIAAISEPMFGAAIVAAGALRGAGDTLIPSVLTLTSMWGVRITLLSIAVPRWGLPGGWAVMAFELWVRGALFLTRLLRDRWLERSALTQG